MAYAATALVALCAGWVGATALAAMGRTSGERPWAETTQALRQNQDDVARLSGDLASIKMVVDALRQNVDQSRAEAGLKQSQIVERLDRADKTPVEMATTLARFGEQLTRLEAGAPDFDAQARRPGRASRPDRAAHGLRGGCGRGQAGVGSRPERCADSRRARSSAPDREPRCIADRQGYARRRLGAARSL